MKTLTLLRHAKAVIPGAAIEDHQRPLAPRGHHAAAAVGRETKAPELVLCSTSLRTRQTLEDVAAEWKAAPEVSFEEGLYLATPEALLRRIGEIDDRFRTAWIVGHNPGIHELALILAAHMPGRHRFPALAQRFPTAARAVFRSEEKSWADFAREDRELADFVIPE
jgi:phosphohistidine phosphatase